MKKKSIFLAVITSLIMLFLSVTKIYGSELNPDDYITSATINSKTVNNGGTIQLNYTFKDNLSKPIQPGDTMTITFPNNNSLSVTGFTSSQILKNSNGVPLANMEITDKNVKLTFLSDISNMQPNTVSGHIYVTASISCSALNSSSGTSSSQKITIPLIAGSNANPSIIIMPTQGVKNIPNNQPYLQKNGRTLNKNPNKEQWDILCSVSGLQSATLEDVLGVGLGLDQSSIRIIPINGKRGVIMGGDTYTLDQLKEKGLVK